MLHNLFLFLCFFGFFAKAGPSSEVTGTNVPAAAQRQFSSPWCYAMSTRFVLEDMLCRASGNCDAQYSPQIAIGSLVRAQAEIGATSKPPVITDWFNRGGDQEEVLVSLENGGRLLRRDCVQESAMWKLQEFLAEEMRGLSLGSELELIFNTFQNLKSQGVSDLVTDSVLNLYLRKDTPSAVRENLAHSLSKKLETATSKEDFLQLILVPAECEATAIALPHYKTRGLRLDNAGKIQKKILQLLGRRQVISLSVCASTLAGEPKPECGPHAVTIVQAQKRCTQGCELSYLMLDSSSFPAQGKNADGSFWVPAALVHQSMIDYIKRLNSLNDDLNVKTTQSRRKLEDSFKESLDQIAYLSAKMRVDAEKSLKSIERYAELLRSKRQRSHVISQYVKYQLPVDVIMSNVEGAPAWLDYKPENEQVREERYAKALQLAKEDPKLYVQTQRVALNQYLAAGEEGFRQTLQGYLKTINVSFESLLSKSNIIWVELKKQ